MKNLLLASLLATILVPVLIRAATDKGSPRIAYISVQKVLAQSKEAKLVAGQIETKRQERSREGAERQKKLEATHQQLVESGGMFKASKRTELKAEEDRQRADLQQFNQKAQAELQELQRKAQAEIQRAVTSAIQEIAERRNFQLVLNGDQAIVWGPTLVDVTAEVVEKMNGAGATPPRTLQTPAGSK